MSPISASCFARIGSLLVSPLLNLIFSSSKISPALSALDCLTIISISSTSVKRTLWSKCSDKQGINFFREYFSSFIPFGRPKCEIKIGIPFALIIFFIVGTMRSMRVESDTMSPFMGTFISTLVNTRLPLRSSCSRVFQFIKFSIYGFYISSNIIHFINFP